MIQPLKVSGHGLSNAKIMLVGDYASKEDIAMGYAISGKAEATLNQIFREHHYDIKQTYRTLYIKDSISYDGKAKKKRKDAIKEATEGFNYKELLASEISTIKPNIIVPIGELSLHLLTFCSRIEKYRGSILPLNEDFRPKPDPRATEVKTIRVIPAFGPKQIWENWTCRVYTTLDFARIVANKDRTDPIKDDFHIWVCRNVKDFREFCKKHYSKALYLTSDIETFAGIPTCISFCFDGREAISVPLFDSNVDIANSQLLLYEVSRLLSSPLAKVNQNIKYDWTINERFGLPTHNITGDTMLAASLIYPELPKGLDFLCSIYTDLAYYKDEGKDFDPTKHSRDRLYFYNAKDSLAAHIIYKKQVEEMKELEVYDLYNKLTIPCLHLFKKIDEVGIRVNVDVREDLLCKYEGLLKVHGQYLNDLAQKEINYNSPKQVSDLIYGELKFPERKHQTQGGETTFSADEETLEELMILHGEENKKGLDGKSILEEVIACRKIYKLLGFINTPIHPDNRFRTSYKLHGTETGRSSGSKTADYILEVGDDGKLKVNKKGNFPNYGNSLQTIPKHGFKIGDTIYGKDIRRMFVPSPGRMFVEVDLSQAEARVDAVLANDLEFLKQFDIKPGVHCLTGSWLFGCDAKDIKKGTLEYHLSKTTRHAGERNIQADGLVNLAYKGHISISRKQAQTLLATFHKAQPSIRGVFHREIREFVRDHRYLRSCNMRRRDFFARLDEGLYNEAISYLPQAIVADQMKQAMVDTVQVLPWVVYLAEQHDGCLAELWPHEVNDYVKIFKGFVEREIDFIKCSLSRDFRLVIPCEVEISSKSWYDMEAYA